MANPKNGPQGKVFKAQISPEARARMEREHREAVTAMMYGAMERMRLSGRCGASLERFNTLCGKIGVSAIQIDHLKKDFAQMMIDEALNGKRFDELYKQYYNQKLSALLAAGANARNEDAIRSLSEGAGARHTIPGENEITNTFENFMRSFGENMREQGIRRSNSLPEYGGNDAKGVFDMQIAAHKTLVRDNARAAYENCSRRGAATVKETCEAAFRAVDNAFFYAHAFPKPSAQGVDANAPGMREAGIRESANVIRGLREVHASRSWLWALLHPIDYLREAWTIRSLKGVMRVRGGLSRAEVAQKLSAPKETFEEVSRGYDEIHERYSEQKLAEAERELAEDRQVRERQRQVEGAVAYSGERMREAGMSPDAVHARGRAEVEADMDALDELEALRVRERSNSVSDSNDRLIMEDDRVSVEISDEQEEKSEPIADSGRISAPQIDLK